MISAMLEISKDRPVAMAVGVESRSTAPWLVKKFDSGDLGMERLLDPLENANRFTPEYALIDQRRFATAVSEQRMQKELCALGSIQRDRLPEISSVEQAVYATDRFSNFDWSAALVFADAEFAIKHRLPSMAGVVGIGRDFDVQAAVAAACKQAGRSLSSLDFFQVTGPSMLEISARLKLPMDRLNVDGCAVSGIAGIGRLARVLQETSARGGLALAFGSQGAVAVALGA